MGLAAMHGTRSLFARPIRKVEDISDKIMRQTIDREERFNLVRSRSRQML